MVSLARLAGVSAFLLMASVVGHSAASFSAPFFASVLGGDPTRVVGITLTMYATGVVAILGLVASCVWYLRNVAAAHGRDKAATKQAADIELLLRDGHPRSAIAERLAAQGVAANVVEEALELDWPRGETCPVCETRLRGFTALNKYLGHVWFHCPSCSWVGQISAAEGSDRRAG